MAPYPIFFIDYKHKVQLYSAPYHPLTINYSTSRNLPAARETSDLQNATGDPRDPSAPTAQDSPDADLHSQRLQRRAASDHLGQVERAAAPSGQETDAGVLGATEGGLAEETRGQAETLGPETALGEQGQFHHPAETGLQVHQEVLLHLQGGVATGRESGSGGECQAAQEVQNGYAEGLSQDK